jgi:hypothetical protein
MHDYQGELVMKSARFIEIPLVVDHGGDIKNRGDDLCEYDGREEEATCGRADPFHDSSGESSQEASDSDDEDVVPDSSSEDESEIITGRGPALLRARAASVGVGRAGPGQSAFRRRRHPMKFATYDVWYLPSLPRDWGTCKPSGLRG